MFDNGSQRSCVTSNLASALSLSVVHFETMMIKIFGSQTELKQECGVVTLGLMLKDNRSQKLLLPVSVFITKDILCVSFVFLNNLVSRYTTSIPDIFF